jgi:hypothetical protein
MRDNAETEAKTAVLRHALCTSATERAFMRRTGRAKHSVFIL